MVDILSALIGVVSICAVVRVIARKMLNPPEAWDEDVWTAGEIEEFGDYKEIREANPHIWMD